jgi:sugar lactone lactonase YvrE
MKHPELILDIRATLGEGPMWNEREQALYFTDILESRMYRYSPSTGNLTRYRAEQFVGTVVSRQRGGLVLAAHRGIYAYDPDSEEMTLLAAPESDPDIRFNDGKCDPRGRFWAGTMSMSGRNGAGALYRLDADGSLHRVLEGVGISNGLGWSPDGGIMYFIDTPTRTVSAFDYDMETGSVANRRTVIEVPESEGFPDGMTVDEEGKLWIAHWGGYQIARWDPATGRKLASWRLPVPNVSSCAFGGPGMDVLFITTAREGLSPGQLKQYPHSGSLFRLEAGVKGAVSYEFGG